jgi:hypothetical protein
MLESTDSPLGFLNSLSSVHQAARARDEVGPDTFLLVGDSASERRIAITDFGTRYYEEGVPVYFAIEMATGAYVRFSWSRESGGVPQPLGEDRPLVSAFMNPNLIDSRDPIRMWLAAKDETVKVKLETRDQMRRFCAAEILRTDQPELFPLPEPDYSALRWKEAELALLGEHFDADVLPYFILFGKHFAPITAIGSGRGRRNRMKKD